MNRNLRALPEAGSFDLGWGAMRPDAGIMRSGEVDTGAYTSAARFEEERALFAKVWLLVGREKEVAQPGDWIVRDIPGRETSILIARGRDGLVRGFYNYCAHRGAQLVRGERKGCSHQFVCPYHAWTYRSDGTLQSVPDRGAFSDLDFADAGLAPVTLETLNGLIFVNLDTAPRQSLRDYLGAVGAVIDRLPLDEFGYCYRITNEVRGNWKAGLEAASEGYHIQALHKDSVKAMVCSAANPFVRPRSMSFHGVHRQMSVTNNPEYRPSERRPVQKRILEWMPHMVVSDSNTSDFLVSGVNPSQADDWAVELFALFPNTILHVALNGFYTFQYWPLAIDRYLWEGRFYFRRAPATRREELGLQGSVAFNRDISTEDAVCVEGQQQSFASGGRDLIRFGEGEMLCRHHAAIMQALSDGPRPAPHAVAAE